MGGWGSKRGLAMDRTFPRYLFGDFPELKVDPGFSVSAGSLVFVNNHHTHFSPSLWHQASLPDFYSMVQFQVRIPPSHQMFGHGLIGCRPHNGLFFLLLLPLILHSSHYCRSSLKHQYFHDLSVTFNISYMVGKRSAPGFIWR